MVTSQTAPGAGSLEGLLRHCSPIALFLDFDGVLAEIAPTPDTVEVPGAVIAKLQSLNSALGGAVAILSGRPIADLDARLAPLSLALAGDHGNSRRSSDGQVRVRNDSAAEPAGELFEELSARFADDPRIIVERKPSAVALHYRLAPERERECIDVVTAAIQSRPELSLMSGKMVVEARAAGAGKGEALVDFMNEQPFRGRTPVFLGDDLTDEDGFAAAQQLGGLGIKVGAGETVAQYRIGRTHDVANLLDAILTTERGMH